MLSALVLFNFTISATFLLGAPQEALSLPSQLSPEIINELKDFLHLIPAATVDEIVAKHYVVDRNFRKAAKYIRSSECKQLLTSVQRIPEIVAILEFLHLQNKSSTSFNAVEELPGADVGQSLLMDWQRRLFHVTANLPEMELLSDEGAPEAVHSFTSFVEELAQHLPRGDYVEMITKKRQRSAVFEAFYEALKSPEFVVMVETSLKSPNLSTTLQTLSSNDIDVNSLKPILFEVLSWGPNANSSGILE